MHKRKLIYFIFSAVFAGIFGIFPISRALAQGIVITKHRPANSQSGFASSSFSGISEKVSIPSFSLPKKKGEFSKRSSITEDSSFSRERSSQPKSGSGEFSPASFSVRSDAQFLSLPTLMPSSNQGEFSNVSARSFVIFSAER